LLAAGLARDHAVAHERHALLAGVVERFAAADAETEEVAVGLLQEAAKVAVVELGDARVVDVLVDAGGTDVGLAVQSLEEAVVTGLVAARARLLLSVFRLNEARSDDLVTAQHE
jgi:hypothetical protein